MRIPRIYQAIKAGPGQHIKLDSRACRHLVQVLRMQAGDALTIFNGEGVTCQATLSHCDKKTASVELGARLDESSESPLAIHLGLGISKGERMDFAIQKAVELGVTEITPLFTRYSMVKLDTSRQQKRLEHWHGIIISACEQCGRNYLPILHPIVDNDTWLASIDTEQKLTLDPEAKQSLGEIKQQPGSVSLYIGPEGGLSEDEIEQARQLGFQGIQLGPRILRTETAVIAALTAVQLQWGDLG